MTIDLEAFKQIPRNDILIYLHQYKHLNHEIKIIDLYERINKSTKIFCFIIDDLINLQMIECKNYHSIKKGGSTFPVDLNNVEIKITTLGEDYVENKLFGYNLSKYEINDPQDKFNYLGFSTHLLHIYKKDFSYFEDINKRNYNLDASILYFLCTGKTFKNDNEKKIFISYSWDDENHKLWIDNLAKDLNQFNVEYDRNLKYGMSPLNYMKSNILSSDYVIIVFTPNYSERIKIVGTGVHTEFSLIGEDLFRKISGGKYLAILKEGKAITSIPEIMQDTLYFNFSLKANYDVEVKNLIATIANK